MPRLYGIAALSSVPALLLVVWTLLMSEHAPLFPLLQAVTEGACFISCVLILLALRRLMRRRRHAGN